MNYGQFTQLDEITFIAQDTVFRRELQLELVTYNYPLALEAIQFNIQKIEHIGSLSQEQKLISAEMSEYLTHSATHFVPRCQHICLYIKNMLRQQSMLLQSACPNFTNLVMDYIRSSSTEEISRHQS